MSFDVRQEAWSLIGETEFYEFDFGTAFERYTSGRRAVTAFGERWLPLSLRREGFDEDYTLKPTEIRLIMAVRPSFIGLVTQGGVDAVALTITRGFGTDYASDYRNPWWRGLLTQVSCGVTEAEGVMEDGRALLADTLFPRVRVSGSCNNELFDSVCGLSAAAFQQTRTVLEIQQSGLVLKLSGAIPGAADYFTLGKIRRTGGANFWRLVTKQAGDLYALHVPLIGISVGDSVDVLPGCDLSGSTCLTKYTNIDRHVGMPYAPRTDPVIGGL